MLRDLGTKVINLKGVRNLKYVDLLRFCDS